MSDDTLHNHQSQQAQHQSPNQDLPNLGTVYGNLSHITGMLYPADGRDPVNYSLKKCLNDKNEKERMEWMRFTLIHITAGEIPYPDLLFHILIIINELFDEKISLDMPMPLDGKESTLREVCASKGLMLTD
jgi:TFIIF-interacting CTD phosphatase-like protein